MAKLRIFLSYGHDEYAAAASRIKDFLEKRGHEVWFDSDRLRTGHDWEQSIEQGLEWTADARDDARVVLVMTPHSVRRPDGFCLNEVARALERRLPILPIMLVLVEPPLSISRIQWLDLTACVPLHQREEQFAKGMASLAAALEDGQRDVTGGQARLLGLLNPLSFEEEISRHSRRFTGREWALREIGAWLGNPSPASRLYWIEGPPGIGKTSLAVCIATTRPEIAAWHFCRSGHVRKSDPGACVTSIAYQLAAQLPGYFERLKRVRIEALIERTSDARTLFDELLVQPLFSVPDPARCVAILIDALDEAARNGRNELAKLVPDFERLPSWLRFIVTSRPTPELIAAMSGAETLDLAVRAEEGQRDVKEFLRRGLGQFTFNDDFIEAVAAQAGGNFLYAEAVRGEYIRRQLPPDLSALPRGLSGIYADFFQRQFPDVADYKRRVRPFLEIVAASQGQLPLSVIARLLDLDPYEHSETVSALGAIYQTDGNYIRPFHKSLTDWITDENAAGSYWVSTQMGHSRLADLGDAIPEQKLAYSNGRPPAPPEAEPLGTRKEQIAYLDEHRLTHLIEARRFAEFQTAVASLIEGLLVGTEEERRQRRANLEGTLMSAARIWPQDESAVPLAAGLAAFAAAGSRTGHYGEMQYVIGRALDAAVEAIRLRPELASVIPQILNGQLLRFLNSPVADVDMAAFSYLDSAIRKARAAVGTNPEFAAWAKPWDAYLA